MAYWSIAILVLSFSFLAYRHLSGREAEKPDRAEVKAPSAQTPRQQAHNEVTDEDAGLSNDQTAPTIVATDFLETETTPKASPVKSKDKVSALSLHGDCSVSPILQPTMRASAQTSVLVGTSLQTSPLPPPPRPTPVIMKSSASSLMPPPARPFAVQRTPPNASTSLRVPSNGPLPNRGPPASSQQRVSGGLRPNGAISTPSPRGKVLLSPGHSPMDWAALTRSDNVSGVGTFQRVMPSQLRTMTGRKGKPAWTSWQGKVYNFTPYLPFHPGGEGELMKAAGRDATQLFMEVHPWVNFENMLGSCLVGVMVPENYGMGDGRSSLEDMD